MTELSEYIDYEQKAVKVYEDEQRRLKLFQDKIITKQVQKLSSENQKLKDKLALLEQELEQVKQELKLVKEIPKLRILDSECKLCIDNGKYSSYKAAKNGHLVCLKYAHKSGCLWEVSICTTAALNGHLECLKYAHENGCPWLIKEICTTSAQNGHLECLKYVYENGCTIDRWTCNHAAYNGHLECLKYAHENCCTWNKKELLVYAKPNCLEYINSH